MRRRFALAAAAVCLGAALVAGSPAAADVKLSGLFSDGMVLQQGIPAPIWGSAEDGEKVTVQFLGEKYTTRAKDGKWMVKLPAMRAGGPFPMTISGWNTIEIKDVFIGEVWVCSGQSNMEWSLRNTVDADKTLAASANPMIRLFTVPKRKASEPVSDINSKWVACGPDTAPGFSAVGYFFGRDLQKALKVPVGLIHTSWGGSPAEVWMSERALDSDPEWSDLVAGGNKSLNYYLEAMYKLSLDLPRIREENKKRIAEAEAKGKALVEAAKPKGTAAVSEAEASARKLVDDARRQASQREQVRRPWIPAELYNGMIAPLIPYGIKGAIWYQGESNAGRAFQYRRLFADMIRNWRQDWGQGDFPFLTVQLAPYTKIVDQPGESSWAELREAQLLSTKILPNAGMAVITDVGEENDIHPRQKEPVGARLALAARGIAYGEKIVHSGPVYRSMKVRGGKAYLEFDHVGSGLVAQGGELKGFAIAGADRKFVWAKAEIQGDKVVVSSPEVRKPVAVRYGWANFPVVNLWNKEGLPATPFRTDDFPMTTAPKK